MRCETLGARHPACVLLRLSEREGLPIQRTTLLLIRHAQVDLGAPPGVLCGWLDLPLSPAGRAHLSRLCERLPARARPDALYTSTLARARETAAALAAAWRLDIAPLETLREIHCGRLEGMRLDELERVHPDLVARNRAQVDEGFAWPEGESYAAFRRRVLEGLRAVAASHQGRRVAVVTHAGVVAQVMGAVRGRPAAVWDRDRPDPLALTEVVWTNGSPETVVVFNKRDW